MSSFWNKSWYEVIRDYSPYSGRSKFLFFAGLLAVMYLAFQVFPQESAFQAAKRAGATNPQLLSAFAIHYPDSYRIVAVDDLLWEAASGPQGNCALYLYRRTFPYGRHQSEAKQRPATDDPGCAGKVF
jgi:hypothetical protein